MRPPDGPQLRLRVLRLQLLGRKLHPVTPRRVHRPRPASPPRQERVSAKPQRRPPASPERLLRRVSRARPDPRDASPAPARARVPG
jgi:hypothetical protein